MTAQIKFACPCCNCATCGSPLHHASDCTATTGESAGTQPEPPIDVRCYACGGADDTCTVCWGRGRVRLVAPGHAELEAERAATQPDRFISVCCKGVKCRCGADAAAKLEEAILFDDPNPNRHPFTAYVCAGHFDELMHGKPFTAAGTQPTAESAAAAFDSTFGLMRGKWDAPHGAATQPNPLSPSPEQGEPTDEELYAIAEAEIREHGSTIAGNRALYRAGVASQAARVAELGRLLEGWMTEAKDAAQALASKADDCEQMRAFLREYGSVIAWCPGAHGKLVDDLADLMAVVAPNVQMPTGEDRDERTEEPEAARRIAELTTQRDSAISARDSALEQAAELRERLARLEPLANSWLSALHDLTQFKPVNQRLRAGDPIARGVPVAIELVKELTAKALASDSARDSALERAKAVDGVNGELRDRLETAHQRGDMFRNLADEDTDRRVALEAALRTITDARQADGEKLGALASTLRRCLAQLDCCEWRGSHGTCIWCVRDEHAADCSHIQAVKAGWKALGERPCPKCARPMEVRAGMFFWRGQHFSGLVCAPCKSLWDNPEDSFEAAVSATRPGAQDQEPSGAPT